MDNKILKTVSTMMDEHFIVYDDNEDGYEGLASQQKRSKVEFLKIKDDSTYTLTIFYWGHSKIPTKKTYDRFIGELEEKLGTNVIQKTYVFKEEYYGKGTPSALEAEIEFTPYIKRMGKFKDLLDI